MAYNPHTEQTERSPVAIIRDGSIRLEAGVESAAPIAEDGEIRLSAQRANPESR
jgi:hypothetical protein